MPPPLSLLSCIYFKNDSIKFYQTVFEAFPYTTILCKCHLYCILILMTILYYLLYLCVNALYLFELWIACGQLNKEYFIS